MAAPLNPGEQRARRRSRALLLLLAALFLGPPLFSFGYHRLGFEWHPAPSTGGVLIEPPRPVALPRPSPGAPGWRLVVPGSGVCAKPCLETLHALRQVRVALGRHGEHFQRVYVHDGTASLPPAAADLVIVPDRDRRLRAQLAAAGDPVETAFYVVDPHGYAMLRYPHGHRPRAPLEDLEHLVRRFGDD